MSIGYIQKVAEAYAEIYARRQAATAQVPQKRFSSQSNGDLNTTEKQLVQDPSTVTLSNNRKVFAQGVLQGSDSALSLENIDKGNS